MTNITTSLLTCAVCGESHEMVVLGPTENLGTPDLDTRPAPLARGTLPYQVMCCPSCGYCGHSLDIAPAGAAEFVRSAVYRQQMADSALPNLANQFLCRALLYAHLGDYASAGWDALNAAWVCDDVRPMAAPYCRLKTVTYWRQAEVANQPLCSEPGGDDEAEDPLALELQHVIMADVLRRSAQMAQALQECEHTLASAQEPSVRALLEFELTLIKANNVACHNISELPRQ